MKKQILFILGIVLVSGCMGRTPNPISSTKLDDENLSCQRLKLEISDLEQKIRRLIPETEKTGSNIALGVAGIFFLPAFCFMDLSDAEKIEVEAYRDRISHLTRIYHEKQCSKK